tara:strand:+ start:4787 stop:5179 length:393 start_codon:yes stop_codon:yes gene_type:complete
MRKDIHPEYREVLFHDTSVDEYFLVRSTLQTDQTKEWTDGNTYPYCPLDVSSASHPFYTGKQKLVDTGGRVDRFRKRFGNKNKVAASTEETAVEEEVMEVAADSEEVTEEAPEATNADKVSKEESPPEDN